MTLAPSALATCTAALPTPLPAPTTSTVSPGRTRALVLSMCHAVMYATVLAASSG